MPTFDKYIMSFKDEYNRDVVVKFRTTEDVSLLAVLKPAANPVLISFQGQDDNVYQPLIASKATINILLELDDSSIFEDLSNLDEDKFGVSITIDDDYEWHGWLIPDEQTKGFSYRGQTITLNAIDVISKLKGQKLLDEDGAYIHGEKTLKYIVQRCFDPIFNPENTAGGYDFFIASTLKLSYDTTYAFPDILEQLTVSSEVFNDDMGRATNAYDVIYAIAESLCMRCFYENRTLYFVDVQTFTNNWEIGAIPLTFLEPGFSDNIFLENSEDISTLRTFKESRARFDYRGYTGLLEDGYFTDWTPDGAGFVLTHWDYNTDLLSQSDYNNRRVGNGRQEDPFGIKLRRNGSDPNVREEIGTKYIYNIDGLELLSASIKLEMTSPDIGTVGELMTIGILPILYNEDDPTTSYYKKAGGTVNSEIWDTVDLTGSSFATGNIDWGVVDTLDLPYPHYLTVSPTNEKQTLTIDLLKMPVVGGHFTLFIVVSCPDSGAFYANTSLSNSVLYEVLISRKPLNTNRETSKGEIVYITRDIKTSQEYLERNVKLNTTVAVGVAGALRTFITYTRTSDGVVVPAGIVPYISNGSTATNVSLIQYNAMVQMNYNHPQYKIDLSAKSRNMQFNNFISMESVYDDGRPSTSIYLSPFIQTRHAYNVKDCTRRLSIVSMFEVNRDLSTEELDSTHDLLENYYIT